MLGLGTSHWWPAMNDMSWFSAAKHQIGLIFGRLQASRVGMTVRQTGLIPDYCDKNLRRHLLAIAGHRCIHGVGFKGSRRHIESRNAILAATLVLAACNASVTDLHPTENVPTVGDAAASTNGRLQVEEPLVDGPWRVECFQDEELVFEHNRIYRVWHPEARPPHWAYETPDGLRFRGRMGTDLNCVWRRLETSSAH